jgi:hypothetical protein
MDLMITALGGLFLIWYSVYKTLVASFDYKLSVEDYNSSGRRSVPGREKMTTAYKRLASEIGFNFSVCLLLVVLFFFFHWKH